MKKDVEVYNMTQQENGMRLDERFRFRELIVLLPVICLSFVTGTTITMQQFLRLSTEEHLSLRYYYSLIQAFAPVPGVVLLSFLSEVKGRRFIFIVLFTLSILLSILSAVPRQDVCIIMGLGLEGVVAGGSLPMTSLVISEYCRPKHRFSFLISNTAAEIIGLFSSRMLVDAEILGKDTIYLQVFGGVLGAVCLGLVCVWWPESPYWLFGKGRVEEGRQAFLWLHGKGSPEELGALTKERRRPGPPRLFWMSLFIAILMVSMVAMAQFQNFVLTFMVEPMNDFQKKPLSIGCIFAGLCIIALVSYKINRRHLFLATFFVSLVFNYVATLCLYLLATESLALYIIISICYVLMVCGFILSTSLFIEMIPQKYNTQMACICVMFVYISRSMFVKLFLWHIYMNDKLPSYFYIILFTTLSVCVLIIVYVLAPETKGKTLLEIQRSYTPEQSNVSTGQQEIMLQNV